MISKWRGKCKIPLLGLEPGSFGEIKISKYKDNERQYFTLYTGSENIMEDFQISQN